MNADVQTPDAPRSGLTPYVVVGLTWWGFLMLALKVPLIKPVFLWVLTQGLLVEKISHGFWSSRGVLLAAYLGAAVVAWWAVERNRRDPQHVWRRAVLAWIGVQAIYCLIATLLVQVGVLYA